MKIKSFKGRRLMAERAIEDISKEMEIPEQVIKWVENHEQEIKKLDEKLDELNNEG